MNGVGDNLVGTMLSTKGLYHEIKSVASFSKSNRVLGHFVPTFEDFIHLPTSNIE